MSLGQVRWLIIGRANLGDELVRLAAPWFEAFPSTAVYASGAYLLGWWMTKLIAQVQYQLRPNYADAQQNLRTYHLRHKLVPSLMLRTGTNTAKSGIAVAKVCVVHTRKGF